MINIKGKSYCVYDDCKKRPGFNFKGNIVSLYCASHKISGMIDIKNPKCKEDNCTKQPTYGFEEDEKASYCKDHMKNNMIDIKHKRCKEKGCNVRPSYNVPGNDVGVYYVSHKKSGMVDVTKIKCNFKDCGLIASFGLDGNKPSRCLEHKDTNMVDVVHYKCSEPGCNIRPTYGKEGTKRPLYCEDHKKDDLVNVVSKRCEFNGCNVIPAFGFKENGTRKFCFEHKEPGMILLIGDKCKSEFCETKPYSDKYNGYCLNCFIHLFPNELVAKNFKTKENSVVCFIKNEFPDLKFIFDKPIKGGKSNKRPDILIELDHQCIIIEIDEDQHKKYEDICENKRIMEISKDLKFKNIVFIRFNPDGYIDKNKNKIPSCWKINNVRILSIPKENKKKWEARLKELKEKIRYWIKNKTTKVIEIIELFYDEI